MIPRRHLAARGHRFNLTLEILFTDRQPEPRPPAVPSHARFNLTLEILFTDRGVITC